MVRQNNNRVLAPLKVVAPLFKAFNNCEQFGIMRLVAELCSLHLAGLIGNGVPLSSTFLELGQDARNSES